MSGHPKPVGRRGPLCLFDVPGHGIEGFTFLQLTNTGTLVRLCGGEDLWLRQSFPRGHCRVMENGAWRDVPYGINALEAARWFSGLCSDAERRRVTALVQSRAAGGPVDRVTAWLRSWRPGRGIGGTGASVPASVTERSL